MIGHIWSILCQNCLVDRTRNTISLIEAIEELTIVSPPLPKGEIGVIPIQCSLVSSWERLPADQPTKGTAKFCAVRPTGEIGVEQEYSINLSDVPRARTIAQIGGISFREVGRHVFEIYMKEDGATEWTKVSAIPITISVQPQPDSKPS